jgi:hypothetical protein
MAWVGEQWELREGSSVIGVITVDEQDFPWLSGSFAARPGFARWAAVFAESSRMLDELADVDDPEGWARWEALYDRISSALTLVAPSEPVADFLLHIDGSHASFRWTS